MAYSEKDKDKIVSNIHSLIGGGDSIRVSCQALDIATSTYMKWVSESEQYARDHTKAMEERADKLFEEILEIADESSGDTKITPEGVVLQNSEFVQRSRLRVDARKWMLGKMQPKKYGDKLDVTSDGKQIIAPQIILTSDE